MNYVISKNEEFQICGLKTEISTSQNENFNIISNHWKKFNLELKKRKISLDKNWIKYGVTTKIDNKYYYMSAVPINSEISDFEFEKINQSEYVCFSQGLQGRVLLRAPIALLNVK